MRAGDRGRTMDETLNETRYQDILDSSRAPVFAFIKESFKEDPRLLLPRILVDTFSYGLSIPLAALLRDPLSRERFAFKVIKNWGRKIRRVSMTKLILKGKELIDPAGTYLFVANHLSPFDIVALYSALPVCAGTVANSALHRIPVLSYWMRLSGAIFVEQGNKTAEFSAFKLMIERLKSGKSLVLFPEGYINQGKDLVEFKRGGIHSAVLARVPIVPVCLLGTDQVMRPGGLSVAPGKKVTIKFGAPIEAWKLDGGSRKNIDLVLREQLTALINGEIRLQETRQCAESVEK